MFLCVRPGLISNKDKIVLLLGIYYIGQLKWGLIFTNFVACVKFIHTLFWITSRIFDLVKITQYNMVCFEKSIFSLYMV